MLLPAQDFKWSVNSYLKGGYVLGTARTYRFGPKRQCLGLQRLRSQGLSATDLKLHQACEGLANSQHLRVHILLVPLVGLERPAEAAAALWRALGSPTKREPLALHSIVVLSSSTFILATDFLPVEPLAPTTALQLLQGKTPGRIRFRQMSRLPSRQVWSVADVAAKQGAKTLHRVVSGWDMDLAAGRNDCHTYTNALIEQLTGHSKSLQILGIMR